MEVATEGLPAKRAGWLVFSVLCVFKEKTGAWIRVAAVFSLLALGLCCCMSIGSIVVGAMYLDPEECPSKPELAPLLLATGDLTLFLIFFLGGIKFFKGSYLDEFSNCCKALVWIAMLVDLGLHIFLCYAFYVAGETAPYEYKDAESNSVEGNYLYCNPSLRNWLSVYIIFQLSLSVLVSTTQSVK